MRIIKILTAAAAVIAGLALAGAAMACPSTVPSVERGRAFATTAHVWAGEQLTYRSLTHTVTMADCGAGTCSFQISSPQITLSTAPQFVVFQVSK